MNTSEQTKVKTKKKARMMHPYVMCHWVKVARPLKMRLNRIHVERESRSLKKGRKQKYYDAKK